MWLNVKSFDLLHVLHVKNENVKVSDDGTTNLDNDWTVLIWERVVPRWHRPRFRPLDSRSLIRAFCRNHRTRREVSCYHIVANINWCCPTPQGSNSLIQSCVNELGSCFNSTSLKANRWEKFNIYSLQRIVFKLAPVVFTEDNEMDPIFCNSVGISISGIFSPTIGFPAEISDVI